MSNISYGFQYRNASDVNLDLKIFPQNFYDTHPQHNNESFILLDCNVYNSKMKKEN